MGLDVTAYEIATRLESHVCEDENACWEAGHKRPFVYDGFEQSARGYPLVEFTNGVAYGEWYAVSGEELDFRAGSYSGYSAFRDALAIAALGVTCRAVWDDVDAFRALPFFELLNFADNEGFIGSDACSDLANDFDDQRELVLPKWQLEGDDGYHRGRYDDWQQAFELARGGGFVQLH